ncbi:MAG TPA: DUF4340 domain-containing protein [Steroidobacteraceae bacterium]|jgi:hypothetical protein|nr:DUF4340 domain-containing protein [Steroidobacteraceae bacterium]
MTGRRVAWLLAGAVALIAVAIWLSSRRHLERDMTAGALVLPGLQQSVNAITTVSLRKGDGTHVTLSRQEAGWTVTERGWPADRSKVRKLLLDLGALNVVEEKTRLAANYPSLGVEDVSSPKASGTLVELVAPSHGWAIIIGKSSSGKSGYVRLASAPQSLLAAPPVSVDADPKDWLERALIDLNVARVREIEEKPAQGAAYSAARENKEQSNFTVSPLPKGRALTGPGAPEPIAGSLSALTLDDVRKAETPAGAQLSHVVFRTFDGLEVELAGRKDGSHALVTISARSSAKDTADEAQKLQARCAGWEFEIPDYRYNTIFKPLEELLQKPPEPAQKKTAAARPPASKNQPAGSKSPPAVPSK